MPELLVSSGARAGTVFLVERSPMVIGRSSACDVVVPDAWISSRHCRLERRGADWWVVDLASRNGTFVDGQRLREAALRPGAALRLGRTEAAFRAAREAAGGGLPANVTQVRFLADATRTVTGTLPAQGTTRELAGRHLSVLLAIGRALVETASLDDSLVQLLHAIASEARAERCAILLLDASGALVPAAHQPAGAPPRLSLSIVSAAIAARAGLLVLDAQQDDRFSGRDSIIAAGIRSCVCVPIWAEDRILGALVLDRGAARPFDAGDLELATVAAYQAALAIERARVLERARAADAQRAKLLRHFSPDVAAAILDEAGPDDPALRAAVREEVTVLFSDIQGFTALTERLPVLELAALLREYFHEMTLAVFEERGTLDKFIGDGLMAIFGAPAPDPEGALRAVRCARRMLERLAALDARLPPDRQLAIRIGVNTGRVAAGTFGSPERMEYTVLGDTVNVAARLQSLAEPGTVYVGRSTWERTRDAFTWSALGARSVKGHAAPVDVYRLEDGVPPA